MDHHERSMREYALALSQKIRQEYYISEEHYSDHNVKRGLRNDDGTGVLIGVTRVGSVQGYVVDDGGRVPAPGQLYYRGIALTDIVENHKKNKTYGFEEVAYLLLFGYLPTSSELQYFKKMLYKAKLLPTGFTEDMILRSPSRNIMNKLARSTLALYSYDDRPDDISISNLLRQSIELIGSFPSIVANAYAVKRRYIDGESLYLHTPQEELSAAENFLMMVRQDKQYTEEEAHLLDMMLMVHAEHGGGNNSTFVCRALSSTGTDTYSAISGAVGALKGPLHGGANAKVMEMFRYIKETLGDRRDDGSVRDVLVKILNKEGGDASGKIYGLGHAVYTISDPRAVLLKRYAKELAADKGYIEEFELMEKIESLGIPLIMERRHSDMPMCANVDMYSGLVYAMLGIPEDLYTPLFATARVAGWCANRIEEVLTGNRIMRPAYRAVVKRIPYTPPGARKSLVEFD
ncbi:MAG: Citrate synthase (si) [Firmicutes bacterium]|nr:Citrate synthase (si) [Bacillota bacterium]